MKRIFVLCFIFLLQVPIFSGGQICEGDEVPRDWIYDYANKRDLFLGADFYTPSSFFGPAPYIDELITFDENYKSDPYDKNAGFDKKFEPNFNLYGIKPGKYQFIRFCAWKVPFVAVSDDGKKQDATLYLLAWGTFKPTADYPDEWDIFSSYCFVAFPRVE